MAGGTEFSGERFNELVLLLAERSADDPRMSRVKLNKLLYRADFEAFRTLGRSISGAMYIRGEHGPMAVELPTAERVLENRGHLGWRFEKAGPYTQKIPVPKVKAKEEAFTKQELEIIEAALAELGPLGGRGAREWSHKDSAGWNLVGEDEPIPYETAFISMERPDESLFRRAKRLARERNWREVRP